MVYINYSSINETLISKIENREQLACLLYDFILESIFMGSLVVIGIFGNTLSMIVLHKDKCKTATLFLLISLSVADTGFLVTVLLLRVLPSTYAFTDGVYFSYMTAIFPYTGAYLFPVAIIVETVTIYLTILVTLNRYISVCKPLESTHLCSLKTAKKYVFGVLLFSVAFNMPRFFELEIYTYPSNSTQSTINAVRSTTLGLNKTYQIIYGNALYCLILLIIPVIALITLNNELIKALQEAKRKRARLLTRNSHVNRSEDDITRMLISVVLVFIVCQFPALITQILSSILHNDSKQCPLPDRSFPLFFYYERFSDLMVVVNSSTNFMVYCFCSPRFRKILLQVITCKTKESEHTMLAMQITSENRKLSVRATNHRLDESANEI